MGYADTFDLVVIGAGPGGYTAALRAAALGMKCACVEREARVGGVCLNVGCIPSKALLDSSEYYALARGSFATHGIRLSGLSFDLAAMMARKDEVVRGLTQNVRGLLDAAGVAVIRGEARLAGPSSVRVKAAGSTGETGPDEIVLSAKNILLATGSEPVQAPSLPFDGAVIVDSTAALSFDSVPERLAVVGGGAIGLELGSVWARLGSAVTIIEMLPKIAPAMDGQVSRTLLRLLKKQGLEIETGVRVTGADVSGKEARLTIVKDGAERVLACDKVLVAVGRRPSNNGLGLAEAGVALDPRGRIAVDAFFRSSVPTIRAIGDLIPGPMLAHKAAAEGKAAVESMAGLAAEVRYDAIPGIVYTNPEAAGVGATEEDLKDRKVPFRAGSYPFTGVGRARCLGETDGFVKVLAHARTDRVLGVHMVGPRASDLIAEAVLAIESGASAEDLGRIVHGHPTFSEALMEASLAASDNK